MNAKLAQASMEYVMIAGFVALVIIPTTYLFYSYASDSAREIDQAQIDKFGRDVVSTAETVYYLGAPSRIIIEERLPSNVENLRIQQDAVSGTYLFTISVRSKGILNDFTFPTKVKIAGVFNNESITAGLKNVRIEAEKGDDGTPLASITFRTPLRVFVTSQKYDGNLGGLAGADAKCQALADAAGLTGTWKAWLSTATENAKDRISNQKYVRTDNARVALGIADLTDSIISNPISMDESRVQIENDPDDPFHITVWTGTTKFGVASSERCNDWTTSNDVISGRFGLLTINDGRWTHMSTTACNTPLRLYCFEQ